MYIDGFRETKLKYKAIYVVNGMNLVIMWVS